MKIRKWTAGLAALAFYAAPVAAQTNVDAWSYDNHVQGVAFASDCCGDDCCGDPCCGDDACCGDPCCGAGVAGGGLLSGCGLLAPVEGFSLASALGLADSGLEFGGWTQIGGVTDFTPLSTASNDLLSFNDHRDRIDLHQQWFYLGKVADGSSGFGLGGRVDVVYGIDAQKTQAFGNPNAGVPGFGTWDASLDHGSYGWAIPQAYGEIAMGDLSVKIGHFFTLVGYEVVPATGNFFYTHAYTMFNSEPFTHTGVLATYSGMENLTLYGGWTAGWDTGFDSVNSGSSLLGGFSAQVSDAINFTYINTYGNFGWRDGGADESYSHSCVMIVDVTDNLQYVGQSDLVATDDSAGVAYDTVGLNQYVFYSLNDVVRLGTRLEWWKADGVSYNAITSGVNIKLLDNLMIRPEYRYDWSPGADIDQDLVGMDMILTY
ncbi:MAG: porin [Pirellulales bacterium]|nr:porin [Pirellulales bacterium]